MSFGLLRKLILERLSLHKLFETPTNSHKKVLFCTKSMAARLISETTTLLDSSGGRSGTGLRSTDPIGQPRVKQTMGRFCWCFAPWMFLAGCMIYMEMSKWLAFCKGKGWHPNQGRDDTTFSARVSPTHRRPKPPPGIQAEQWTHFQRAGV